MSVSERHCSRKGYDMAEASTDRRVVRTKRLIRKALTELIEEQGLDGITVCNLTERADINRGTFYAHYRDKADLLEQTEKEITDKITDLQSTAESLTMADLFRAYFNDEPMPFIVTLYSYLQENGNFIRALIGPKGDPAFQPRLQEIVADNVVNYILAPKYQENMTPFTRYYVAYHTNAQLGVIKSWLDNGMQESPEEMARMVVQIMFLIPGESIEMNANKNKGTNVLNMLSENKRRAVMG
jgi:AcrR family transcriptional regulator